MVSAAFLSLPGLTGQACPACTCLYPPVPVLGLTFAPSSAGRQAGCRSRQARAGLRLRFAELSLGVVEARGAGQPFLRRWRAGGTVLSSLQSWQPDCPLMSVVTY